VRRFNDIKYTHYALKIKAKFLFIAGLKNESLPFREGRSFQGFYRFKRYDSFL
jgi:hypothetical protein